MSISRKIYTPLNELLRIEDLPDTLGSIRTKINERLSKLFYKQLIVSKGKLGDFSHYSLDIVSPEEIKFDIGADGVTLILNKNGADSTSSFPITVKFLWRVMAFKHLFEGPFDYDITVYTKGIRDILGISDEKVLANTLDGYIQLPFDSTETKVERFIADIKESYPTNPAVAALTPPSNQNDLTNLLNLVATATGETIITVILNTYLLNGDGEEDNWQRLKRFFSVFLVDDPREMMKKLLIPECAATVKLIGTLELPRKWVIPVADDGTYEPLPEPEKAEFTLAESLITLDTKKGLSFQSQFNLSTPKYIQIGKTGLIAKLDSLTLDLSEKENLPEINNDGRVPGFKGVFIKRCLVLFPPNWHIQTNTGQSDPPVIEATNMIFGNSGGVSVDLQVTGGNVEYLVDDKVTSINQIKVNAFDQKISILNAKNEALVSFKYVPNTRNYYIRDKDDKYYLIDVKGAVTAIPAPSGILRFKIGNQPNVADNLQVSLNSFNISIRQNKVIAGSCVGTLIIPRSGSDSLVIKCTLIFEDGFLVKAWFPKEQPIVDNAFTTIKLKGLELGKVNDANHFGFAANAEIKHAWPFLDKFLPKKISVDKFVYRSDDTLDYTVGLGWKSGTSVTISSDQPTEIVIPIHKDTSKNDKRILSIKALKVVAEKKENAPADPYLSIAATFIEAQLNIGNVRVELSDLGFESKVSFPADGGNFGPAEVDVDFIPPKSGKLFIDAGFIKGKGSVYYNEAEGSFDGVLELELTPKPKPDTGGASEAEKKESKGGIQLKGIVCLQTKMPDGSKGFSLLIILTAEFDEKPLGMGFTISGIGGLLGLNRTSNTEFLRNGLRTGALDSILFPVDPVKNAQKIISDVKSGFPVAQDRFIIGPLLKLGWGKPTLIKIDLGLFIELPAPIVISLLGVAKVDLPKAAPGVESIVTIKLAFLAVLDFGKKQFSLDAAIYESTFKKAELSGDIAVRLWWGDNKLFLVTVGGFHPAFEVPPANLPTLRRLALTIRNDDKLKIWAQVYTAITSNTFQFGAELFLEAGDKYMAKARFWLDVLFRFNPFYFIANVGAEAGIYKGDKSLLSAYLSLSLEGPGPYRANGIAEFKVFGVGASVKFNKTFGDESNDQFLPQEIWAKIKAELEAQDAWEAILPENNNLLVTLKKVSGVQRFHPTGGIQISQKLAPSNFVLEKFGNTVPKDVKKFTFTSVELTTGSGTESISFEPSKEDFAIADFKKMNDEEKLSAPSFVKMENGIITSGLIKVSAAYSLAFEASYELAVIDRDIRTVPVLPSLFEVSGTEYANDLAFSTAANSAFSTTNAGHGAERPDPVTISGPKYTVANIADLTSYESTPKWFSSPVEAEVYMNGIASGNPATLANMQIADNYELVI